MFKTFKKDAESALVVVKTSADGSVCIFFKAPERAATKEAAASAASVRSYRPTKWNRGQS